MKVILVIIAIIAAYMCGYDKGTEKLFKKVMRGYSNLTGIGHDGFSGDYDGEIDYMFKDIKKNYTTESEKRRRRESAR